MVFQDKLLGRIFAPKTDKATGRGRELHNEELHNLVLFKTYC
jgi:hypothetical protein